MSLVPIVVSVQMVVGLVERQHNVHEPLPEDECPVLGCMTSTVSMFMVSRDQGLCRWCVPPSRAKRII